MPAGTRHSGAAYSPGMDLVGRQAELTFTVTEADTALAVGSGDLPVLGTPRLLAWLEAATCAAVAGALPDGHTSVGTRVDLEHRAPSPVDRTVHVRAVVTNAVSRAVTFAVTAAHPDGEVVGQGTIGRVVVDRARFLSRLE